MKPWGASPGRGAGGTSAQVKESQAMPEELGVLHGAGDGASSQDAVYNTGTLVRTARPANADCRLETILLPVCPHTPSKVFCHQKTATNYHEVQDKTQTSLFTRVSAGLPLQIGAKTPKRIPSSGKETALTLSPHRKKFCSERSAIFSCFPNENYAKLQTSVSSVPLNYLNTISWQMFLCGIEVSVIFEISSFFNHPPSV